MMAMQPPPRGCVLKHQYEKDNFGESKQPPPRGCVLKPKGGGPSNTLERSRLRAAVC